MGTPKPETTTEFSVEAESIEGATIVRVTGELDLATHERLSDELTTIAAKGEPIVVDLSKCDFVDSSGIRSLLVGAEAAEENGAGLMLAGAKPQVTRILDVTGVAGHVPLHASADKAVASLTK